MPTTASAFFMQSQLPILIIGQGIAGTLLSFELWQHHIPFRVLDELDENCASFKSAAVLNPYSGRTIKGVSRRQAQYDIAYQKYTQLGQLLGKDFLNPKTLLVWEDSDCNTNLPTQLAPVFSSQKVLQIEGVAKVNNPLLLLSWREWLLEKQLLSAHKFDYSELQLHATSISYQDVHYSKIIFCNGVQAMKMDIFKNLRFTENRGDILLLHIPALDAGNIYQKDKVRLVPLDNQRYWCGSNYIWNYQDMRPSQEWRAATEAILNDWLQTSFQIEKHIVAKRPTTAGQIPFIGWHPQMPQVGICNGLGTKGFSAGPAWIDDFVHNCFLNNGNSLFQQTLEKQL